MTTAAVSVDAPTRAHVIAALERLVYLSARDCEAAERRVGRAVRDRDESRERHEYYVAALENARQAGGADA